MSSEGAANVLAARLLAALEANDVTAVSRVLSDGGGGELLVRPLGHAVHGGKVPAAVPGPPLHVAARIGGDVVAAVLDAAKALAADAGCGNIVARQQWGELKRTPLHVAAAHRPSTRLIRMLVDAGADVNARDATGATPLATWCTRKSGRHRRATPEPETDAACTIRDWLELGADPDAVDLEGATVLLQAVRSRAHVETIDLLLAAGARVDAVARDGSTLVWCALAAATGTTVRSMFQAFPPDLHTDALRVAPLLEPTCTIASSQYVAHDDVGVVQLALPPPRRRTAGRLPKISDAVSGPSAGHLGGFGRHNAPEARAFRYSDATRGVVAALLRAGASAAVPVAWPASRPTPVAMAAIAGDELMVTTLLDAGASVDGTHGRVRPPPTVTVDAATPLMYAARFGRRRVVRLLLSRGADIDARGTPRRISALHAAVEALHEDVVVHLVDSGATWLVGEPTGWRMPLLHYCATEGMPKLCARLLRRPRANPAQRTRAGVPLLHVVVCSHDSSHYSTIERPLFLSVMDALCDLAETTGCANPVDATDVFGRSALHVAVHQRKRDVVQALLKLADASGSIDINRRDGNGHTPMRVAVDAEDGETIAMLAAGGADTAPLHHVKLKTARKLVLRACGVGNVDMLGALMDAGCDVGSARDPISKASAVTVTLCGDGSLLDKERIVSILLNSGAPLAEKWETPDGGTTLHACARMNLAIVLHKILDRLKDPLQRKLELERLDTKGRTPFGVAAHYGSARAAAALCISGASVQISELSARPGVAEAVLAQHPRLVVDQPILARACYLTDVAMVVACLQAYRQAQTQPCLTIAWACLMGADSSRFCDPRLVVERHAIAERLIQHSTYSVTQRMRITVDDAKAAKSQYGTGPWYHTVSTTVGGSGSTPLLVAAARAVSSASIVSRLLEAGMEVDTAESGTKLRAIHAAAGATEDDARDSCNGTLRVLLDAGASVDPIGTGVAGDPIAFALQAGRTRYRNAAALLNHGCVVSAMQLEEALSSAGQGDQAKRLALLLLRSALPRMTGLNSAPNHVRFNLIRAAARIGSQAVCELLDMIDDELLADTTNPTTGLPLLCDILQNPPACRLHVVSRITAAGADAGFLVPTAVDKIPLQGGGAITVCVRGILQLYGCHDADYSNDDDEFVSIIRTLVASGADTRVQDSAGLTPALALLACAPEKGVTVPHFLPTLRVLFELGGITPAELREPIPLGTVPIAILPFWRLLGEYHDGIEAGYGGPPVFDAAEWLFHTADLATCRVAGGLDALDLLTLPSIVHELVPASAATSMFRAALNAGCDPFATRASCEGLSLWAAAWRQSASSRHDSDPLRRQYTSLCARFFLHAATNQHDGHLRITDVIGRLTEAHDFQRISAIILEMMTSPIPLLRLADSGDRHRPLTCAASQHGELGIIHRLIRDFPTAAVADALVPILRAASVDELCALDATGRSPVEYALDRSHGGSSCVAEAHFVALVIVQAAKRTAIIPRLPAAALTGLLLVATVAEDMSLFRALLAAGADANSGPLPWFTPLRPSFQPLCAPGSSYLMSSDAALPFCHCLLRAGARFDHGDVPMLQTLLETEPYVKDLCSPATGSPAYGRNILHILAAGSLSAATVTHLVEYLGSGCDSGVFSGGGLEQDRSLPALLSVHDDNGDLPIDCASKKEIFDAFVAEYTKNNITIDKADVVLQLGSAPGDRVVCAFADAGLVSQILSIGGSSYCAVYVPQRTLYHQAKKCNLRRPRTSSDAEVEPRMEADSGVEKLPTAVRSALALHLVGQAPLNENRNRRTGTSVLDISDRLVIVPHSPEELLQVRRVQKLCNFELRAGAIPPRAATELAEYFGESTALCFLLPLCVSTSCLLALPVIGLLIVVSEVYGRDYPASPMFDSLVVVIGASVTARRFRNSSVSLLHSAGTGLNNVVVTSSNFGLSHAAAAVGVLLSCLFQHLSLHAMLTWTTLISFVGHTTGQFLGGVSCGLIGEVFRQAMSALGAWLIEDSRTAFPPTVRLLLMASNALAVTATVCFAPRDITDFAADTMWTVDDEISRDTDRTVLARLVFTGCMCGIAAGGAASDVLIPLGCRRIKQSSTCTRKNRHVHQATVVSSVKDAIEREVHLPRTDGLDTVQDRCATLLCGVSLFGGLSPIVIVPVMLYSLIVPALVVRSMLVSQRHPRRSTDTLNGVHAALEFETAFGCFTHAMLSCLTNPSWLLEHINQATRANDSLIAVAMATAAITLMLVVVRSIVLCLQGRRSPGR